MGRDKAPLEVGGRTMLSAAIAALSELTDRVVLACGEKERYVDTGRELVLDRHVDTGPLAGLEAGLTRIAETEGGAWVAVLACDMPQACVELLAAIYEEARAQGADACLLRSEFGLEPLYAIYHTRCLPAVRRALRAGRHRMTSFHRGFGELAILAVSQQELPDELVDMDCPRNVNTPRDLAAAQDGCKSEATS